MILLLTNALSCVNKIMLFINNMLYRFSRTVEVKQVSSPVHSSHNTGIPKPVTPLSVRHVVVLALCFGILVTIFIDIIMIFIALFL